MFYIMVFLLPFSSYFSIEVGNITIYLHDLLVVLLIYSFLFKFAVKKRNYFISYDLIDKLFLCLILWMLFSYVYSFFSFDQSYQWLFMREHANRLRMITGIVVFYFSSRYIINERIKIIKLFHIIFTSFLIMSLIIFYFFLKYKWNFIFISSSLKVNNLNNLIVSASWLSIITFSLSFTFLNRKINFKTISYYVIFVISIIVPILLLRRNIVISSFLAIIIVGFFNYKNKKYIKSLFGIFIIMIILFNIFISNNDIILSRLYSIREIWDENSSPYGEAYSRIKTWKHSLKLFKENLLFGIGFGNYPHFGQVLPSGGHMAGAHNDFLQIAAETGIFGLMIFSFYFIFIFKKSYSLLFDLSSENNIATALAVFITAITITSLSTNPFFYLDINVVNNCYLFWVIIAILVNYSHLISINKTKEERR